jgi:hypothetical protein
LGVVHQTPEHFASGGQYAAAKRVVVKTPLEISSSTDIFKNHHRSLWNNTTLEEEMYDFSVQ